jgi:hypothetical protein
MREIYRQGAKFAKVLRQRQRGNVYSQYNKKKKGMKYNQTNAFLGALRALAVNPVPSSAIPLGDLAPWR